MTETLKELMGRAEKWPAVDQQALARVMLDIESKHTQVDDLTEEDWKIIDKSVDQTRRGEFATEEEMATLFNKYRKA